MTTYEYIKAMRKKKENRVQPTDTTPDKSNHKPSHVSNSKEIKKSILKGINKTVIENPYSFSVAKSASDEEILHLTAQIRTEVEDN